MTLLRLVGGLDSYYKVKYLSNTHKKNIDFDSFIFTVSQAYTELFMILHRYYYLLSI